MLAVLLGFIAATAVPAVGEEPTRLQPGDEEVIDITGFMEWPKGDTRLTWDRPETFRRDTDLVFGLPLKDEVFRPVDRNGLSRAMAVQRMLGRVGRSDGSAPVAPSR